MNIEEGNKLIAEFMNNKHSHYSHNVQDGIMYYNSSWDWLMPVWVKFKNIDIKGITELHYHKQVCASFGNGILSGDINNAWSDAVMAIKWYNH